MTNSGWNRESGKGYAEGLPSSTNVLLGGDLPSTFIAQSSSCGILEKSEKVKKPRPLGDRVLVRVMQQEAEVIVNGLIRPDIAVEKPLRGVVVAVGKGRFVNDRYIPIDVEVGQEVEIGKYCGNEIEVLGEKLLIIKEDELQLVYDEE